MPAKVSHTNRPLLYAAAALAFVLLPPQWASCGLSAVAEEVHGKLEYVSGVRVLRVWGTATERGYAQGIHLARDILQLFDASLRGGVIPGGAAGYEQGMVAAGKMITIPPPYQAELHGMLAGIQAALGEKATVATLDRPLRYGDLLAINYIPDSRLLGCSSFAVWGAITADGSTLAGRNLDWLRLDALKASQLVVVHTPQPRSGRLGWVSVTWPGYIGCLTGMNAEGVTVSMHDVRAGSPSVASGFTPRGLTLREAIESAHAASAIEDVTGVLREHITAVGNNVVVAMPSSGSSPPSVVFEYDGVVTQTHGVTVRVVESGTFQVCTNHYVKRAEPAACDRYATIEKRLAALARRKETLGIDGAWKLLQAVSRPRNKRATVLTYHSAVFEPGKRTMHVAFFKDGKPAPMTEPVALRVDRLLAGTHNEIAMGPPSEHRAQARWHGCLDVLVSAGWRLRLRLARNNRSLRHGRFAVSRRGKNFAMPWNTFARFGFMHCS